MRNAATVLVVDSSHWTQPTNQPTNVGSLEGTERRLAWFKTLNQITPLCREMAQTAKEAEAETALPTPPRATGDLTLGLPDEVLIEILLLVPFAALWEGRCARVCRRWRTLVQCGPVERRRKAGRWEAYANGWIKPQLLSGHAQDVDALAVGPDGTLYSGSWDTTVRVWSGVDGAPIRTLEGHREPVFSLAVGPDGAVYSGSRDYCIRVWCKDGGHVRTLACPGQPPEDAVLSLAVGLDDKLYAGSEHGTISVWSTRTGAHIRFLNAHTDRVFALLVGPANGRVYSASGDTTIKVWSGDDGAHLDTLDGHTAEVTSLAWGPSGKLYSGSDDATIRVWSGGESTVFTSTGSAVGTLVWSDTILFAGSEMGIWMWSSEQEGQSAPSHAIGPVVCGTCTLCAGLNGALYAGSESGSIHLL
jgi:WD40 repeat protein